MAKQKYSDWEYHTAMGAVIALPPSFVKDEDEDEGKERVVLAVAQKLGWSPHRTREIIQGVEGWMCGKLSKHD